MVTRDQLLEPLALRRTDEVVVTTMSVVRPWGTYSDHDLDFASAERNLKHACDLAGIEDAASVFSWRSLAALQWRQGDDDALESIETAISSLREKDDPASYMLRARCRLDGPPQEWIRALQDATDADAYARRKDPKAKRVRALAHLRNDEPAKASEHANKAIELGDEPTVNRLILAIAHATLGHRDEARQHLTDANESWPPELRNTDSVIVTADKGVLWFDTNAELTQLRDEAVVALAIESDGTEGRRD